MISFLKRPFRGHRWKIEETREIQPSRRGKGDIMQIISHFLDFAIADAAVVVWHFCPAFGSFQKSPSGSPVFSCRCWLPLPCSIPRTGQNSTNEIYTCSVRRVFRLKLWNRGRNTLCYNFRDHSHSEKTVIKCILVMFLDFGCALMLIEGAQYVKTWKFVFFLIYWLYVSRFSC